MVIIFVKTMSTFCKSWHFKVVLLTSPGLPFNTKDFQELLNDLKLPCPPLHSSSEYFYNIHTDDDVQCHCCLQTWVLYSSNTGFFQLFIFLQAGLTLRGTQTDPQQCLSRIWVQKSLFNGWSEVLKESIPDIYYQANGIYGLPQPRHWLRLPHTLSHRHRLFLLRFQSSGAQSSWA